MVADQPERSRRTIHARHPVVNAPVLSYRLTPEAPATFADLDLVRVTCAITTDEGETVPAGTRGTIVAVYRDGAAYEVEFSAGVATIEALQLVAA